MMNKIGLVQICKPLFIGKYTKFRHIMKLYSYIVILGDYMKKILLCILCFGLFGCQSTTKVASKDLEKNEQITIVVTDKEYGNVLKNLWDKKYPEQKDAIIFNVQAYYFSQEIRGDIVWTNDIDAPYILDHFANIESLALEYEIPKHLQRKELADYYVPILGEGTIFAYDEEALLKKQNNVEQLSSFEEMRKNNIPYYHNHLEDYIYPFLSSLIPKDGVVSINSIFQGKQVEENLKMYKEFYQASKLQDDLIYQRNFYEHGYPSGLLSTKFAYEKSDAYKKGNLHFMKMPSWNKTELHPPFVTSGFAVNKNCKAINLARAFLEMVRSKEGIQVALDANIKVPVIKSEDILDFKIYNRNYKELIEATDGSQLYNQSVIKENPAITLEDIFNKSDITSTIQNYICSNENAFQVQKKLINSTKAYVMGK